MSDKGKFLQTVSSGCAIIVRWEYRYRLWLTAEKISGLLFIIEVLMTVKSYFFLFTVVILIIINPEITIPAKGVNTERGTRGVKEVLGTTV